MTGKIIGFFMLLTGLCGSASAGPLQIDRIDVEGVRSLDPYLVEGAMEIRIGEDLEHARVVRSAENLKRLYTNRGYEEVGVQTSLTRDVNAQGKNENVVLIRVKEGRPVRIGRIRIRLSHSQIRVKPEDLVKKTGLNPGDIFDQERVGEAKRLITDILAGDDFAGAQVTGVESQVMDAPLKISETLKTDTTRWVDLEFLVDVGERVSFGFRGNQIFDRMDLMRSIEQQRQVGFGSDFIDAIRQRIEDEYRNLGYAEVKVSTYNIENPERQERHVTYLIEEGLRIKLGEIVFDGNNEFGSALLRSRFFESASKATQNGYYVAKDIDKSTELLMEWIRSQGYLSSRLLTTSQEMAQDKKKQNVKIYLFEGDQTRIQSIEITGVDAQEQTMVRSFLKNTEGAPLNLFALSEGLEALKSHYISRGYLGLRIVNENLDTVVRYTSRNQLADIRLEIEKGPLFTISKVEVEGLEKTHPMIVTRELELKEGDVIEEVKITKSESRLRKLGIFSEANLRFYDDSHDPEKKLMRVIVREGTPGVIAGGPGYRNDLGIRVFVQGGYSNLFRRNHSISLSLIANRRLERFRFIEYEAQLGYVWPWFLFDEMTFRPRITLDKIKYLSFSASTLSFAATWERYLLRAIPLTGLFTYRLERVDQFEANDLVDQQKLTIGSVTPELRIDYRDNPLVPTSGFFANGLIEVASPLLPSRGTPYPPSTKSTYPVGYSKIQFRSDYFWSLPRNISLYFSFRTGFEQSTIRALNPDNPDPNDPEGQIPLIKRFALGGVGSLRGFSEQELNHQNVALFGTASYVNYRTQLDLPFYGAVRIGPFLDAANLNLDRYSFGALRYGVGAGLRYQTPVGPVNFDLGFKLDPKPNEDPYRFYFSIGVI